MSEFKIPKKLIEVALPLDDINAAAEKELKAVLQKIVDEKKDNTKSSKIIEKKEIVADKKGDTKSNKIIGKK